MSNTEERWLRAELLTSNADVTGEQLWELGAAGVETQDQTTFSEDGSIPPVPEGKSRLISFFQGDMTPEELKTKLVEVTRLPEGDIGVAIFEDESWKTEWLKYFKPLRLSRRSIVGPPWETFDPPSEWTNADGEVEHLDDGVKIIINPGIAFGTGNHETTQLVASILDDMLYAHEKEGQLPPSLLDVGCGSGILSILAYLLGVPNVRGIDIDEDAIATANETLEEYQLTDILLTTIPIAKITQTYPIVLANILGHIVLSLKNDLARVTDVGGVLIVSGVLTTEADTFANKFCGDEFKEVFRRTKGEWVAYVFQRQ